MGTVPLGGVVHGVVALCDTQLHVGNKSEPIPAGGVGGGGNPALPAIYQGEHTALLGSLCVTHGPCCPLLLQDSIVWAGAKARPLASTPDSAFYSK